MSVLGQVIGFVEGDAPAFGEVINSLMSECNGDRMYLVVTNGGTQKLVNESQVKKYYTPEPDTEEGDDGAV